MCDRHWPSGGHPLRALIGAASVLLSVAAIIVVRAPALADGRLSVLVNPVVVFQGSGDPNDLLGEVGLGYDFGPKSDVPVDARVRLDVNEFFGTGASDGVFSIGFSARSTKALYFGGGVSVDTGSIVGPESGPAPAVIYEPIGLIVNSAPQATTQTEVGVNLFLGQKLISRPGFGLDLEASYRFFPSLGDMPDHGVGLGLRTSFL